MVNRSKGNEFFQAEQQECVVEFEYKQCLDILNQYIPVNLLADKLHPMEKLRDEFGLGMNQEEEKAFARLFESESATV